MELHFFLAHIHTLKEDIGVIASSAVRETAGKARAMSALHALAAFKVKVMSLLHLQPL